MVFKFTRLLNTFSNLVELSLSSIEKPMLVFKALAICDNLSFA